MSKTHRGAQVIVQPHSKVVVDRDTIVGVNHPDARKVFELSEVLFEIENPIGHKGPRDKLVCYARQVR
jgi:hypothetical protein